MITCGASADHLSLEVASGRGIVESFTVIHRSPHPDFAVPYTVALVRLTEGPVLLSRLISIAGPTCDQDVEVDWWPLGDGRHLPVFRSPTAATAPPAIPSDAPAPPATAKSKG